MADYRQRLAERLVHEREKRSYSQDTLALRAGVSAKTIKRIEEQKVDAPRPVTIRRLAEALEVEPDQLRPPVELAQDQLDRIEDMLRRLLDAAGLDVEIIEEAEEVVFGDAQEKPSPAETVPQERAEGGRQRAAS